MKPKKSNRRFVVNELGVVTPVSITRAIRSSLSATSRVRQGAFSIERWVNLWRLMPASGLRTMCHDSREDADECAAAMQRAFKTAPKRVACIRMLIEGREGDGLKPKRSVSK